MFVHSLCTMLPHLGCEVGDTRGQIGAAGLRDDGGTVPAETGRGPHRFRPARFTLGHALGGRG